MAFSNDEKSQLPSLKAERIAIKQVFERLESEGKCELIVEVEARLDDIFRVFSQQNNNNRIAIFHYAGHADGKGLHTVNTIGENKTTYASGLAKMFAIQKNLKLVFLNGCSTEAQVEVLQSENIPNVIATSKSISDSVAKTLAEKFYAALVQNKTIDEAFRLACAYVEGENGIEGDFRKLWKNRTENVSGFPWKSSFKKGDWRLLNARLSLNDPFKIFLAYSTQDKDDMVKLRKQLKLLKRQKLIDIFDEAEVQIGTLTKDVIAQNLDTSHIILLFVTENLFDDAEELIDEAVRRNKNEQKILIPIYVRRCPIEDEEFAKLEPLPRKHLKNGQIWRFVDDWDNEDNAYYEIAMGLRNLITALKQENS
ncbi:MAG: TIR domain-containing protein [Chitinophagales bacterium]